MIPAKKNSKQYATKSDLENVKIVLKTEIKEVRNELKAEIGELRNEFKDFKNNMLTFKDDVLNGQDEIIKKLDDSRTEKLMLINRNRDHEEKLENHEGRITRLEKKVLV